jgi:hypothetical protein
VAWRAAGTGGDVQVELKVYVEDPGEFEDLRGWMTGQHLGMAVTAVPGLAGRAGLLSRDRRR